MVFKGLSKRLKKYDRLPKDPEEEQARKALDKERAEVRNPLCARLCLYNLMRLHYTDRRSEELRSPQCRCLRSRIW